MNNTFNFFVNILYRQDRYIELVFNLNTIVYAIAFGVTGMYASNNSLALSLLPSSKGKGNGSGDLASALMPAPLPSFVVTH